MGNGGLCDYGVGYTVDHYETHRGHSDEVLVVFFILFFPLVFIEFVHIDLYHLRRSHTFELAVRSMPNPLLTD